MENLRPRLHQVHQSKAIVGMSIAAENMRQFAERAASSETTVLLTGETGVGKDHLAEYIHALGGNDRPFVPVDCGLFPPDLMESELFGHVAGSFSGAVRTTEGLVQKASGGTLFLNEIANLPFGLQAKLLRLAEGKTCRKVGSTDDYKVETRIIAGTNANLKIEVKEKRMRSDLYYRIATIEHKVEALRERKADISSLALHFLSQTNSQRTFSNEALDVMRKHDWPGNLRELKSLIDKVLFYSSEDKGEIQAAEISRHLEPLETPNTEPAPAKPVISYSADGGIVFPSRLPHLKTLEEELLKEALRRTHGIHSRAAFLLGLTTRTLAYKVRSDKELKAFWNFLKQASN